MGAVIEPERDFIHKAARAGGLKEALALAEEHNCSHENCQCWLEVASEIRAVIKSEE